jgi:hypothetical protein
MSKTIVKEYLDARKREFDKILESEKILQAAGVTLRIERTSDYWAEQLLSAYLDNTDRYERIMEFYFPMNKSEFGSFEEAWNIKE